MLKTRFHRTHRLIQKRLFHSVYCIKPNERCLEQENQACFLTKTVVQRQLPPSLVNLTSVERDTINDQVKQCIINTNHFHGTPPTFPARWKEGRREFHRNVWRWKTADHTLLNILRVLWSTDVAANLEPHSYTYQTELVAPWERLGNKVQVTGRHGNLISGKKLLPLFANEAEVNETCDVDIAWDDLISPFFGIQQQLTKYEPRSGFASDGPFPCPQTFIAVNPIQMKTHFNTGESVFFSFAHALNYALASGEKMGEDLINPVPIQGIVFNGKTFDFVCYQLNTLNFSDEQGGKKNIAWILGAQQLYDKIAEEKYDLWDDDRIAQLADADYEDYVSIRRSLEDFDRKVLTKTFRNKKNIRVSISNYNPDVVNVLTDFVLRSCSTVQDVDNDPEYVDVDQVSDVA